MKDTAESLLDKLRPLSDQECIDLVRKVQANYRLPGKARTIGEMLAEARHQSGAQKLSGHDIMAYADDPASERKRTVGAKCRKAYDLDENGQRIPDGKGGRKNHREDTTNWNDKGNVEIWRAAWAAYTNRAQESAGRPERIDHRSYKRQGRSLLTTSSALPAFITGRKSKQKPAKQLDKVNLAKREQFEQRHSRELIPYDAAARYLKELKDSGKGITPKYGSERSTCWPPESRQTLLT